MKRVLSTIPCEVIGVNNSGLFYKELGEFEIKSVSKEELADVKDARKIFRVGSSFLLQRSVVTKEDKIICQKEILFNQ